MEGGLNERLGVMQGRLSKPVDGKIQAFPVNHWQNEFSLAKKLNIRLIEWTLDHDGLYDNPLMNPEGRKKILSLCEENLITVKTLTCDCVMQKPFWRAQNVKEGEQLVQDFLNVCESSSELGVEILVIPLVDNSSVSSKEEASTLIEFFKKYRAALVNWHLRVAFESDFQPNKLSEFIGEFPASSFGINYDTGNSASLGFNMIEEFACYGSKIINVHIKDRKFGGSTVPLGHGSVDFVLFGELITQIGYSNKIVLQAARGETGFEKDLIQSYLQFIHHRFE